VLKSVRDVSIVGQEKQPLGVEVESSDIAKAGVLGGKQVVDGVPFMSVLGGAKNACGLVKADPEFIGKINLRPIHLDAVSAGLDLGSELGDYGPVDADPAVENHRLGLPTGSHAGSGQKLLNPHAA
jgi:hypothetical protein